MVLTPRRRRQVGGSNSASDGDKKARSPGRVRRNPLKPLRAGMPGVSGVSVVTNACAFYFAHAAAGAWAPGIPHALLGGTPCNGPDALRRGVVNACLDYGSPGAEQSGFLLCDAMERLRGRVTAPRDAGRRKEAGPALQPSEKTGKTPENDLVGVAGLRTASPPSRTAATTCHVVVFIP